MLGDRLPAFGRKPYFADENNGIRLYRADSLKLLEELPDESIDMIFADPPYFLSNDGITCKAGEMVSVNKGKWDKSPGIESIHEFNTAWLEKCQRVLTKNGTIWVSGTTHVIFSVGLAMQQLRYKVLNDITWFKTNAPPNLSCRYFTHSTEHVIWAAKSKKSKHKFDYKLMKEINGGKQMRDVWNITAPGKGEKQHGKHPTQKPLALLERLILASTEEGDVTLDPFAGSGTTALASLRLRRRSLGIELDKDYLALARKRLKEAAKQPRLL
ncbi:MAG: site-specific DNA-methyltransferase [Candidatus Eisenbacteria bacterium]